jgi:hypothetical protein
MENAMKRFITVALTALLAVTVVTPAAARTQVICGDFCVQADYPLRGTSGNWFLDGQDAMLFAERDQIEIVSTVSQKRIAGIVTKGSVSIISISLSNTRDYMVVGFNTGELVLFDTYTLDSVTLDVVYESRYANRSAVSNDGRTVFVALHDLEAKRATIRKYVDGVKRQEFVMEDYGSQMVSMSLNASESALYVAGGDVEIPWLRFDTSAISSGPVASSTVTRNHSAGAFAIADSDRVFGGSRFDDITGSLVGTTPKIFELNSSTLATTDSIEIPFELRVGALEVDSTVETLYALLHFSPRGGAFSRPIVLKRYDANTLTETGSLSLDKGIAPYPASSFDIDPTGQYLLTRSSFRTYAITLDDSLPRISPQLVEAGGNLWVDWNYIYLNPKAKFKQFEVRFVPSGATKSVTRRVKRATELRLGSTAPLSSVEVRAVYTKKMYNTAWIQASPAT